MASYTPMIEQYQNIKNQHPDEILFFRLGDFYEMFFEDAEVASRELEITLTGREAGQNTRVPMCGIPYHAVDNYLAKLIGKGYKVAICEQVEDPKSAKGIVRREVIKIVTPGTILSESCLPDKANNFLAVLYENEKNFVLAAADASTGECLWSSFNGWDRFNALADQLIRLTPAEIVLTGSCINNQAVQDELNGRLSYCTYTKLAVNDLQAIQCLPGQHFAAADLPQDPDSLLAVGYLLYYLHQTVKNDLSNINRLVEYSAVNHLLVDAASLRNLEVIRNTRDGSRKDTLLSVLDFTKTAMGSRLLKRWLEYPLLQPAKIIQRQDAVAALLDQATVRYTIQTALKNIYDFERIMTRIEVGTANGRDMIALKSSLTVLPAIKQQLTQINNALLNQIDNGIDRHDSLVELIESAIVDNPPFSVREGNIIKSGYHNELDELRHIATDSKQWVQNLETSERERTGIKSLKVGYNKVFGYYLEVTHSHAASVPSTYVRKQTLANAERYITPELKAFEGKILGAQEKIVNIEYELFCKIRDSIKEHMKEIQKTARHIAQLDCILGLSEAASQYNYVRPRIRTNRRISIKDGRHPVVERLLVREMFVPNDVELNHQDNEIMVITGPNMAGKSTYMRQVALLVLMAQVGSFIPAREAAISPVDRIFTRVGASDDLATGQSTFMVEMNEVAHILKHATKNSLIILDEIGRGTSTFDGMSIAQAVIEHIYEHIGAKTLFATHYHELTELAETNSRVKNFSVAVKERGNEVVFLRRIVPGGADKSYGIYVAQLAGLPKKTVERAKAILLQLEKNHSIPAKVTEAAATTSSGSMSLFTNAIIEELLSLDVMTITPIEAINLLYKLQTQAKEEVGQ
ncbi:MAG: DNA mismatch repair protein MutS [Veillonellales bacterium]